MGTWYKEDIKKGNLAMMQKLKSISMVIGAVSLLLFPTLALTAGSVYADTINSTTLNSDLCAGSNLSLDTSGTTSCPQTSTDNFQTLLTKVINIFTVAVGIIAVIMIIVGGLRYITSGGESNKVGGAKTTIIYALVGLVVVALAQLVVHFVLSQSANVTAGS